MAASWLVRRTALRFERLSTTWALHRWISILTGVQISGLAGTPAALKSTKRASGMAPDPGTKAKRPRKNAHNTMPGTHTEPASHLAVSPEQRTAAQDSPGTAWTMQWGRTTVHHSDVNCLGTGQLLNDNIIWFYIQHLRASKPQLGSQVYFLDTYFYAKLTSGAERKFNYEGVKGWIREGGPFACQYIVIPICEGCHWYLVIICRPDALTPEGPTPKPAPQIITLDPLGMSRKRACQTLLDYLKREAQERKMRTIRSPEFIHAKGIPRQSNGYDCGVFMLAYIENFLENPHKFQEELSTANSCWRIDAPLFREKIRSAIFRRRTESEGPSLGAVQDGDEESPADLAAADRRISTSGERPIACPFCDEGMDDALAHLRKRHAIEGCIDCFHLQTTDKLMRHLKKHCPLCRTIPQGGFRKHLVETHGWEPRPDEEELGFRHIKHQWEECPICKTHVPDLWDHLGVKHGCAKCSRCDEAKILADHLVDTHAYVRCPHCSQLEVNSWYLELHFKQHNKFCAFCSSIIPISAVVCLVCGKEPVVSCSLCERPIELSSLQQHTLDTHRDTTCPFCDKRVATNQVRQHLKETHLIEKCTKCEEVVCVSALGQHMKNHKQPRIKPCSQCQRRRNKVPGPPTVARACWKLTNDSANWCRVVIARVAIFAVKHVHCSRIMISG